jgi:microcystin-dependent protein
MPGTPPVSPNFAIPRFSDEDEISFSAQVNSVTDDIDSKLEYLVHQPGDFIISAATSRVGALLCNGAAVLGSAYPNLAAILGTGTASVYGPAATGYMTLPDARGRVILGAGAAAGVSGAANHALGSNGGQENPVIAADQLPPHGHLFSGYVSVSGSEWIFAETTTGGAGLGYYPVSSDTDGLAQYSETGQQPAPYGEAFPILQPFVTANLFIKT